MDSNYFCSTWSNSENLIPKDSSTSIDLSNDSLLQIVKIYIGGEKFRIKISSKHGIDSLEIKSISLTKFHSQVSVQIDLNSIKNLTFNNN